MLHGLLPALRGGSGALGALPNRSLRGIPRAIATSAARFDQASEDLGPPIRRPRKYLDMKTFRKFLKQQKTLDIENEKRAIARAHAKKPPGNRSKRADGWDVVDFLKAIDVGDGAEAIAESFESWNDFISSTMEVRRADAQELYANTSMTNKQRRKVFKYIKWVPHKRSLYNHGLWPNGPPDYVSAFQAPPLKNEGRPWDAEADRELLRLAEYYDADFGDPWLYISWEMQRTIEDVQERYTEIALKPRVGAAHAQFRADRCDFGITHAHEPLMMNRKFKLDPPFLYIIPSEENFPLSEIHAGDGSTVSEPSELFSPKFRKYRNPAIF